MDEKKLREILRNKTGLNDEGKNENLGFRDEFEIVAKHKDGTVFAKRTIKRGHTVKDAGKAVAAALLIDVDAQVAFSYIAIGTGTPGATALGVETKRKSATKSRETTNVTNDTAKLVATFSSTDGLSGTATITEAGTFNATTAGVMFQAQSFSGLPMDWDAGDSLEITEKTVCS